MEKRGVAGVGIIHRQKNGVVHETVHESFLTHGSKALEVEYAVAAACVAVDDSGIAHVAECAGDDLTDGAEFFGELELGLAEREFAVGSCVSFEEPVGEAGVDGASGDAIEAVDEVADAGGEAFEECEGEVRVGVHGGEEGILAEDEAACTLAGDRGGGVVGAMEERHVAEGPTRALGVDDVLAAACRADDADLAGKDDAESAGSGACAPEDRVGCESLGRGIPGEHVEGGRIEGPEEGEVLDVSALHHRM